MDLYIFNLINGLAGKRIFLDFLGVFLAKYSAYLLIGILVSLLILRYKKCKRMVLKAFVSGILARFAFTEVVRFFWQRPRPFEALSNISLLLPEKTEPSFPSGHAAFYFALATVVYFYNKKLGYLFFAVSLLMGFGRIFVGYHWPSDILAGATIGIFSGFLMYKIFKKS